VLQDYAVVQLLETKPSEIPPYEKVEAKATQKARQQKLEQLSKDKAQKFLESIGAATDLKAVAEKAKLILKTSDPFTKGGYISDIGSSPEISGKAFGMKVGEIAGPLKGEQGYVVFQLKEKKEFDPAEFAKQKEQIRRQLLDEKENNFFQAYRGMLRDKYKEEIWINQDAIGIKET